MACHVQPSYYDIELLKKANMPIDQLSRHTALKHRQVIRSMVNRSRVYENLFYDITPALVKTFKDQAETDIHLVKRDLVQYGYLYFVIQNFGEQWFNAPHFDYEQFPLMIKGKETLAAIRSIAQNLSRPHTTEFDATCLYLVYFYGLLANPEYNWITMDYISKGDKHHAYGTRLERKEVEPPPTKRVVWK